MNLVSYRLLLLLSTTLTLSACAGTLFGGYGPNHQTKEEYIRYVEGVFKLQNSVTSEIMLMQENGEKPKNQEALFQSVQLMDKTCAPLNDYVEQEMDGQSASFFLQHSVEKSASNCEQAAKAVKALLPK